MRMIGLKTCDTCRKALAALTAAGHAVTVTDVRADGLTVDDISAIVDRFPDRAINRPLRLLTMAPRNGSVNCRALTSCKLSRAINKA